DTTPGSLRAPTGATNVEGLSRYYSGYRLPHMHGIRVHDPRHRLFVGVDIRGGHIFFRPNKLNQFRGVAAGHALQLANRHLLGVANHAPFGATKWNVDHGALPRHPAGQRAYLIEGYIGGIADSTL